MVPREFITEVIERVNIVDVIDEYVPLKKSGSNYKACCPFHNEKTPSFTVSPQKQFFHCFGCGESGSVIDFLEKHLGLSFVESIEKLAQRVGMVVPDIKGHQPLINREEKKKHIDLLLNITQQSAQYYHQVGLESNSAQDYLAKRGLTHSIIEKFFLGYAPQDPQALSVVFEDYSTGLLEESGMVIQKENKRYDRFRGRIIFPIRNLEGNIIAFGGRILDVGEPKYLNSPETPLFDKSQHLYGLYESKQGIKEAEKVLLVEGYMDVISLAQNNIHYAVATLGTATNSQHISKLMRFSNAIYFCFDADTAGKKAAWRALENSLEQLRDDKALYFLFLPEGYDPDSYVTQYGKQAFEDLLSRESLPLSQYFLQHLIEGKNLHIDEIKSDVIKNFIPLYHKIKANALRYLIRKNFGKILSVDEYDLDYLIGEKDLRKRSHSYRQATLSSQSHKPMKVHSIVEKLINWLLIKPEMAQYVEIADYHILDGHLLCLLALAEQIKYVGYGLNFAQIIELMRNTEYFSDINRIIQNSDLEQDEIFLNSEQNKTIFLEGMQKIKNEIKQKEIMEMKLKQEFCSLSILEQKLLSELLKK